MRLPAFFAGFLFLALFIAPGPGPAGAESRLKWLDYEAGLSQARKEGKFVLVDFYTSWCRDCKKMDKTTFADPEALKLIKSRFVPVKVDAEARKDLAKKYQVVAYPTLWALDPSGGKASMRIGYMPADEFRTFAGYVLSGSYKTTGYQEYLKKNIRR